MKRQAIAAGILSMVVTAVLFGTGLAMSVGNTQRAQIVEDLEKNEPSYTSYTDVSRYTIRAYNGHVALFMDSFAPFPAFETDIDVNMLRAYDRQLLEDGIEVDTYEEVLRLFEDFGS